MSAGVPAWLPLNSQGWPDSDRQFSEERAVVPAHCPPESRAAWRCHGPLQPRSQFGEVGWADNKSWLSTCWGDIIMQKSWNRCWRVDKNLLLICRDFRMGKARGEWNTSTLHTGIWQNPKPCSSWKALCASVSFRYYGSVNSKMFSAAE